MANVKKYTDQIAKAQKGRDVRDSIVKAINEVSDENNEYNIFGHRTIQHDINDLHLNNAMADRLNRQRAWIRWITVLKYR